MSIAVEVPETPAQLDEARALMRAFVAWHKERHGDDIDLINAYFDDAAFEDEFSVEDFGEVGRHEFSGEIL